MKQMHNKLLPVKPASTLAAIFLFFFFLCARFVAGVDGEGPRQTEFLIRPGKKKKDSASILGLKHACFVFQFMML